jgi:cold shock protein
MALTGKVKWFDAQKGYGFIEQADGAPDVFVHYLDVICEGYQTLKEGERVTFEVSDAPKGKKAVQVRKIPD